MFLLLVPVAVAQNFIRPPAAGVGVTRRLGGEATWGLYVQAGISAPLDDEARWRGIQNDPWWVGPMVRLDLDGFRRPRGTVSLRAQHWHGASHWHFLPEVPVGAGAEIGYTWALSPDGLRGPRVGIHGGWVGGNSWSLLWHAAGLELAVVRSQGAWAPEVGAGYLARPPHGDGFGDTIVDGRPLRVDGDRVQARIVAVGRAPKAQIPEPIRIDLAHAWIRQARDEHTAVAAFLQIARELTALGAPPALIQGALRSARQEVAHTRRCLDLAGACLGQRLEALPLSPPQRDLRDRTAALSRLAAESWTDGCLGEGAAARRAGMAAERTLWTDARAVNRQVEREEGEHARLSEGILRWCLAQGGAPVRRGLEQAASAPAAQAAGADRALLPGGISTTAINDAAHRRARRDALGVLAA